MSISEEMMAFYRRLEAPDWLLVIVEYGCLALYLAMLPVLCVAFLLMCSVDWAEDERAQRRQSELAKLRRLDASKDLIIEQLTEERDHLRSMMTGDVT